MSLPATVTVPGFDAWMVLAMAPLLTYEMPAIRLHLRDEFSYFRWHGSSIAQMLPTRLTFVSRQREVQPPSRVVINHLSETHHFFFTISFQAHGDKTLVGWLQVFDTAQERARIAQWVLPANEQNLDRLQAELQECGR